MSRSWHRRLAAAPAFTLIEVMIVMGLLVLLASIAWPAIQNQIKAAEMPESAERIRTMLFMTRSQAVMEHRRYRVRFIPEHQHPLIEYEPDPIRHPGVFELLDSGWAEEPMLLADVQVHQVRLGRPIWTKPLSNTSSPDELEQEDEEEEERTESEMGEDEHERELFLRSIPLDEDIEVDENRPMIVFEADGSSDWAELVLARVNPEEELEEETPQLWVVLDGRTGLAYIRDKVTEEQLSDPEFFVEREKLELPDLVDIDNLSFEVGDSLGGGGSFSTEGDDFSAGEDMFGGGLGDEFQGVADDLADLARESNGAGGEVVTRSGGGFDRGEGRRDGGRRGGGSGEAGPRREGDSELDKKLESNPDLTDEEREKMRKSLGVRGSKSG